MRRFCVLSLIAALVAYPARPLYAQQDACATIAASVTSASALDQLNTLYTTECLGGAKDLDPLTKRAMKVLPARVSDAASKTEIRLVVLSVLDPVLIATADERDKWAEGSPERAMLNGLDSSAALARSAVDAELTGVDVKLLLSGTWRWDPNTETFGELAIPLASTVNKACAQPSSDLCKGAYQTASFVLRAAKLVERGLSYYGRPFLVAALAKTTMRDARWTAYFDETLVQFPWELALNSARFSRAARATSGFAMPPSDQWVLLHPMLGVEYVWSGPQGSRMTPAVAMEVLGYNRWSWGMDNKARRAWGASIAAVFSDRANANSMGYGLLVRYAHKYSLTVTSRSGKTGVMLSSELGQWLNGKQDQAKNAMRLVLH